MPPSFDVHEACTKMSVRKPFCVPSRLTTEPRHPPVGAHFLVALLMMEGVTCRARQFRAQRGVDSFSIANERRPHTSSGAPYVADGSTCSIPGRRSCTRGPYLTPLKISRPSIGDFSNDQAPRAFSGLTESAGF